SDALKQAISLRPNADYHSNLLNLFQYDEEMSDEELTSAHRQWDTMHASSLLPKSLPAIRVRSSDRPLRLGFVSRDFARHPTSFLSLSVLESLDKSKCRIVCY